MRELFLLHIIWNGRGTRLRNFSPTHALALDQFTNAEEVVCYSVISLQPTHRILLEYQLQHQHQKSFNHKKDWRIGREIALGTNGHTSSKLDTRRGEEKPTKKHHLTPTPPFRSSERLEATHNSSPSSSFEKNKLIHEEGWRIQGNFSSDRREIAPDETGTPVRNSILVGEKDPFFITTLGAKNFDSYPIFGISEFGVSGPEDMETPNPHQSQMKK